MSKVLHPLRSVMLLLTMTLLTQVGWGQYVVDFEGSGETKTVYASGSVTLNGIGWNMTECLIGTEVSDYKIGVRSARLRGYSTSVMTMNANKPSGVGTISFSYRRYGTDAQVTWVVEYTTDNGANWTQAGDVFTAPGNDNVQNFSSIINVAGDLRIRIRHWSGGTSSNKRLNIDNITLTDYTITPTITGSATAATFTTTYGTASDAQSFSVSGSDLTADLLATAPTGFEVSNDGTTYGATATFVQSGGSASGSLRIRLKKDAAVTGTYDSKDIVLSSTGATSVNITTASSGNAVSAKGLTITANNKNKTEGDVLTGGSGSTEFSSVGLENSETVGSVTITYGSGAAAGDPAGTYVGSIVPSAATGGTFTASNYTLTYIAGDLTVLAASLPKCPASTAVSPSADQVVCSGLSATQLTASITTTGATGTPTYQYQWYYNSTNSNTIAGANLVSGATSSTFTPPSTSADQGTRYYFCVGYSADNTCSQDNSTPSLASGTVKVTVNVTPDVPTGSVNQSFCSSASPTVVSLAPSGSNVSWFSAASGGTALLSSEVLVNGTVYYAESVSDGCPSASRFAVTATVNTNPNAPAPPTPQTLCFNSMVSDLQATGSNVLWYTASSGGTALPSTDLLTSRSYFATVTESGCESPRSTAVSVSVQSAAFSAGSMVQTTPLNHLVISQVYGGGGNVGATYQNDFVEIFNPTNSSVNLTGYSIQYASNTGSSWSVVNLSGSIASGKYALIKLASNAAVGSLLPTADITGNISMSATVGKVALVSSTTPLSGAIPSSSSIVDLVGFGSTASAYEGNSPTASPSASTSIIRYAGGYTDSDVNGNDFYTGTPVPRNSSTSTNAGEGELSQSICATTTPRKMTIEKAAGSGSYSYQWYYKSGIVSDPSGSSVSGWTSLGSTDGANTNAYTPSSTIAESRTYACFVTPGGTPSCGTAQWASGARKVTVYQANSWYGETSTDWSNSSNWGVCGTPSAGADVTIGVASNYPTLNAAASVGGISIASGTTLTLGASGNLSIAGAITNNGTLDASDGTITFNGSSAQSTSGLPASVKNLVINNAADVTLSNDLTITGELTMTAGKLTLGTKNLLVNGGATGSSTSYVNTDGTGSLKRSVTAAGSYDFPIGTNNYAPITFTLASIGSSGTVSARTTISDHPQSAAGFPLDYTRKVNRYWTIENSGLDVSTYPAQVDFNWDISELGSTIYPFNISGLSIAKYGTSWSVATSTNKTSTSITATNIRSFSDFVIALPTGAPVLPVSLLSFSGYKDGVRNQLRWVTATETNNSGFQVERSADGLTYQSIGFVRSLSIDGNSQTQLKYNFVDASPTGIKQYYRLKQLDVDGRSNFSNILLIQGEKPTTFEIASVFPNPSRGQVTMLLSAPANETVSIRVLDLSGRILETRQVNVLAGNNSIPFDLSKQAKGQYLIAVGERTIRVVRE